MIHCSHPMPDIELAIMIIVHIHSMSCRGYHLTNILPAQVVAQVNDLCWCGVNCGLELLNDVLVLASEIAQLKGDDVLFNDPIEVNHVVRVQLVVLYVKSVYSHLDSQRLVLLDVVHDIWSVVSNTLRVAVSWLEKREIMILTKTIIPVIHKQYTLGLVLLGEL